MGRPYGYRVVDPLWVDPMGTGWSTLYGYRVVNPLTRFRYFFHQTSWENRGTFSSPSWENRGTFSSQLMGKVPRARARARARAWARAWAWAWAWARAWARF